MELTSCCISISVSFLGTVGGGCILLLSSDGVCTAIQGLAGSANGEMVQSIGMIAVIHARILTMWHYLYLVPVQAHSFVVESSLQLKAIIRYQLL